MCALAKTLGRWTNRSSWSCRAWFTRSLIVRSTVGRYRSEESEELLHRESGLFQDVCEGGTLDGSMSRNDELQRPIGGVLLEPDVATPLPDHHPACSAQRLNYGIVVQAGHLGHTAISTTSPSDANPVSSSTGSK